MGDGEAAAELRGDLMSFALWMLLHLVLAAAGTWLARGYALRRQLLDQPGERRSHRVATPRGGGVAIVATVLAGMAWLGWREPGQAGVFAWVAAGLVVVAAVGWIDDHRPLSPWWRLLAQAVAGGLLVVAMTQSGAALWICLLAWVLVLGLSNAWNFMDGIDGMAASQALVVAGGFGLLLTGSGAWTWLAAGVVAAILGFLPFNFPRARIFLGDVGSGALGYLVAVLLVVTVMHRPGAWPVVLLPLAAFLVDTCFTLLSRMLRGEKWWAPHVQHAYQEWARVHGSHAGVTLAYVLFSLAAVLLMLGALRWSPPAPAWMSAVVYAIAACVWISQKRDRRLSKETGQ